MRRKLELFVAAQGEGLDLKRVRAEIRLPAPEGGNIRVLLFPELAVPTAFHMPFRWSLAGDIRDMGGTARQHIEAIGFTRRVSHRTWDKDTTDTTIHGTAEEVRVTTFLRAKARTASPQPLVYRLSPGPALNPAQSVEYRWTGDVRVRTIHRTQVPLAGAGKLRFSMHHDWKGTKERTPLPRLVGEIRSKRSAEALLPQVDDVLTLASVAMRYRVVCTGWLQAGRNEHLECYWSAKSPRQDEWDENNALIERGDVAAFLARSLKRLRRSSQAPLLRQALQRVVPLRRESIDGRFIRLFAVLESLVLLWARAKRREAILSKSAFRRLRDVLERELRKVRSVTKRTAVRAKIGELNRPTFADAFTAAAADAGIETHEFWPLRTDKDGVGLTWIRNKLSHGDYLPYRPALEIAGDHLQWIVERLLLLHLGWPTEQSRVGTRALQHLIAYDSWRADRVAYSGALGSAFPKLGTDV